MSHWSTEAKNSAQSVLAREVWNRQWHWLSAFTSHSAVTRLCYCFTRGCKPRTSVADFLKKYAAFTIEQLEREFIQSRPSKNLPSDWISLQITAQEQSARTKIRHLTLEQYFVAVGVDIGKEERARQLELEIARRVHGLHREIALAVIRESFNEEPAHRGAERKEGDQ